MRTKYLVLLSTWLSRVFPYRGVLTPVSQVAIFACSGLVAFLLRFEFKLPDAQVAHLATATLTWVVIKTAIFYLHRLDRGWWRFVSLSDVGRLAAANLAGSVLSCIALVMAYWSSFPRSVYVLDLLICFMATAGMRILTRMVIEGAEAASMGAGKTTLIYGAGAAGVLLLRELRSNPRLGFTVRGFIDDDVSKKGASIQGVPVLGGGAVLPHAARRFPVEQILVAVPSASGAQMAAILQNCYAAGIPCKTVPTLAEVMTGRALTGQIRDVSVEDLLGREPARLESDRIRHMLSGKTVLVTGAAGSIGSELCRQVARFDPAAIVGFEVAETALFHLDREMRGSFPNVAFHPEIGSIQNLKRLQEVFELHSPAIVFHAAAYKHVPMMELHLFEAVENNVFGTYNVARTAQRRGVEVFVMISSDKAVRPTNIMGATKRIAEQIVNSLQNGHTKFASVRFGNVLGSNGSVVPLFKEQIAAGGPVTVTHPEMRRYFMTIPEAAQLVLQASAMSTGGEIFVLDMGAPVKIVDLARNLILLSGLRPDENVKIEFTGVRPGEKLYEEISSMEENTLPTHHEKINIFAGNGVNEHATTASLAALSEFCAGRDVAGLVLEIRELVPEYNPSTHVLRKFAPAGDKADKALEKYVNTCD